MYGIYDDFKIGILEDEISWRQNTRNCLSYFYFERLMMTDWEISQKITFLS